MTALCSGDGEMFQIKKPKHSRHIAKQLKKASQREKEEVTEQHPGVSVQARISMLM